MKVLINNQWIDGFLDYCPQPGEDIIQVLAWRNLEKSSELYFVRPKSFRLLWNYLREIGPKEVLRKIISRSQEKFRNEKFISCGIGRIVHQDAHQGDSINQLVGFLAPNFPACVERISLPRELITFLDEQHFSFVSSKRIFYLKLDDKSSSDQQSWWSDCRGWSNFSGNTIQNSKNDILKNLVTTIYNTDWKSGKKLPIEKSTNISFSRKIKLLSSNVQQKKSVLFGYGNYAKTIIIPNIKKYLSLTQIHEVDPVQIPLKDNLNVSWSTCPFPLTNETFDVFFIAGFHHTHAPLAISAIEQGAVAVIEKPIVTTYEQLESLISSMQINKGTLFAGFHKRYIPMNQWAREDMNLTYGEPVSYHCIVYEVPLPKYHWYRWPNSQSRLISNGCHWTDHFLYLNNFSRVVATNLFVASDGTINCTVELANGACFTMTLTDKGSERIGVRDYIELRNKDVTVTMINGSIYQAENSNRILRKKKINKMLSYKVMYDKICKAIARGKDGDSVESVYVSASLILDLEEQLQNFQKI